LNEKLLYSGHIFDLFKIEVLPGVWFDSIRHPGAVVILPIISPGKILLIEEFRPVVKDASFSCPAGLVEEEESLESAALRELEEECGYVDKKLDTYVFWLEFSRNDKREGSFIFWLMI